MSEDAVVEPITHAAGTGIPVRGHDIDTDQIVPARFLKVVTFQGMGELAFFDVRFDEDDNPKDHPFNDERFQGASILVVNSNFGCGSSREHAPQALVRWGIDAIIGESFADIFAGNCLAMGVPTVTAPPEEIVALQDWIEEHPDDEIAIDVPDQTVTYGDVTLDATFGEAQRRLLMKGIWDTTEVLRANMAAVDEKAASLPYINQAD